MKPSLAILAAHTSRRNATITHTSYHYNIEISKQLQMFCNMLDAPEWDVFATDWRYRLSEQSRNAYS
jgi:hypothetical protein